MSLDDDIAAVVDRAGWQAISVSDRSPSFVYTVGLMATRNHPELIIFGLGNEGYNILRAMFAEISNGRFFVETKAYSGILAGDRMIATRPVHPSQYELYLGFAMGYCRRGNLGGLKALQIFWPDKHGKFPFEHGCEDHIWSAQPRLDQPVNPDELREFRSSYGTP